MGRRIKTWFLSIVALLIVMVSAPPLAAQVLNNQPVLRIETGMHVAPIFRAATDSENRFFVTATSDMTIRVWELPSGKLLKVLRPPADTDSDSGLYAVAISPDGKTIACGSSMKIGISPFNIFLFDRETGKLIRRLKDIPAPVQSLAYSKNGDFLVAGMSKTAGIRVYRIPGYVLVHEDSDYGGDTPQADFNVNRQLVTVSHDGFMRLYDQRFQLIGKIKTKGGDKPDVVNFSPDGSKIAVGFMDSKKIDIYSGNSLSHIYSQTWLEGNTLSLCWSPDGKTLYGSSSGDTGFAHILKWPDEGRGNFQVVSLRTNSHKSHLALLRNGSIAFATREPSIGVIDKEDNPVFYKESMLAHFWGDSDGLHVSPDGSAIQFNYINIHMSLHPAAKRMVPTLVSQPASFSIITRQLDQIIEKPIRLGSSGMLRFESAQLRTSQGQAPVQVPLPPITHAEGLDVKDWQGTDKPMLNDIVLRLDQHEIAHCRAFTPDKQYVLLGTSKSLRLFDKKGNEKWRTPVPLARAVNIAQNGKVAVASHDDGTIRWYRVQDGKELLAFFPHVDKKRWVLWTSNGYYDAATGAEELIGWHINNGIENAADFFPISRFRSTYYRPDVIARILETQDDKAALLAADSAAGRKTEEVAVAKMLPPVVSILYPADGSVINSPEVVLRFSVRSPSGDPVTGVRVLVDGRPVKSAETVTSTEGDVRQVKITIPEKDSEITVLASNRNATSEPSTIRLRWPATAMIAKKPQAAVVPEETGTEKKAEQKPVEKVADTAIPERVQTAKTEPPKPQPVEKAAPVVTKTDEFIIKPKLYILAIGVSNYRDKDLRLGLAAKDAKDFANAMVKQKGWLYRDVSLKVLLDEMATKDEILDGLDWITQETTSKDVAMIFLAGHGVNDPNGIYYFLPFNTDLDKLKRTGVPFSDIKNTVSSLAGKIILFVDTCHSGNIMGSRRTSTDINALVNELASAENGAVVFSSSTGRQYSIEDPAWGNGAFTKALVEGISGKADLLGRGRITVNMLDLYLSERVKELTKGKQTPTTAKPNTIPDFPLVIITERR